MESHSGELISQGRFKGFGVVVEDFNYLDTFGCFGKGTFSRGKPLYYHPSKFNAFGGQIVTDISQLQNLSNKWFTRMRRREFLYSDAFRIASFTREIRLLECKENTLLISNIIDSDCTLSPVFEPIYETSLPISECHIKDNFVEFLTGCILKNRKFAQGIFELNEFIHLSHEEAFYLTHVAKTFCLIDENFETSTLSLIWNKYNSVNSKFKFYYAAYVYFKSKGWLPKSGYKYGVDLVLYKLDPEYTHSDYGVVLCLDGLDNGHSPSSFEKSRWMDCTRCNRNLNSVVKKTLICYINLNLKECRYSRDEYEDIFDSFNFSQYIVSKWDNNS